MDLSVFFLSPPDQTVTANKDKEQHGGSTQNDLAVIAGLFFSLLLCFIFSCLIENEPQLFVICHSLRLPSILILFSWSLDNTALALAHFHYCHLHSIARNSI